jgi:predicted nucleic acid-binding protein
MSLIYWDTMLFVYWLEEHPEYAPRVGRILDQIVKRKDDLCTSAFTLCELLAGPYKAGKPEIGERIVEAMRPPFVRVLAVTEDTARYYARIRARHGFSSADCLHLASAAEAGADLFLTNDRALAGKFVEGIQFVAHLDAGLFEDSSINSSGDPAES